MFLIKVCFLVVVLFTKTEISKSQRNTYEEAATCDCGVSPALTKYIFSGNEVTDMRLYPWMVSLHDVTNQEEAPWGYCGGTLISADTVLTAAHCIYIVLECVGSRPPCMIYPESLQIGLLGASGSVPASRVNVKRIIPHEEYKEVYLHNDIAVVKLAVPVPCTEYTRPICLTGEDVAIERRTLNIAGFGRQMTLKKSDVLRDGTTRVVDGVYCRESNAFQTICTLGESQQSCQSDSGSPAMMRIGDQFYIVGITSDEKVSCSLGFPGVYTRVAAYYSFIEEALNSY